MNKNGLEKIAENIDSGSKLTLKDYLLLPIEIGKYIIPPAIGGIIGYSLGKYVGMIHGVCVGLFIASEIQEAESDNQIDDDWYHEI